MFKRPQSKFSTLRRIADVACAALVVFYLLFDVLDVDGSNFAHILAPTHKIAFELTPAESEFDLSAKQLEVLNVGAFVLAAAFTACAQMRGADRAQFSPLRAARDHGSRLGLARNSLPDSSPYF